MTQNAIQTEGKAVAQAITDHIEQRTDICLNPTYLEPVNDILRVHVRCDAQVFHDGRTNRDAGPNEPLPDQLINWLNDQADDLRPFIRNNKIFLEQRLAWVPAASGAILELAIDGLSLLSETIGDLIADMQTQLFAALVNISQAVGLDQKKWVSVLMEKIRGWLNDQFRRRNYDTNFIRRLADELLTELKQVAAQVKTLAARAGALAQQAITKANLLLQNQWSKLSFSSSVERNLYYTKQLGEVLMAEVGQKLDIIAASKWFKFLSRGFQWLAIGTAVYNIVNSENWVETAFVEVGGLAGGFAGALAAIPVALGCGPAAPVCFVVAASLFGYLGSQAGQKVGQELYNIAELFFSGGSVRIGE